MSEPDIKTRLGTSLVWFALGMVVAGVVGTIAALGWLEGFVDKQVQAAITQLPPGPTVDANIPKGAVMAFDLATGCPDGWGAFKDAGGRTIIGAGAGMIPGTEERDESIQTKKYRQHGGEEKVKLTFKDVGLVYDPEAIVKGEAPLVRLADPGEAGAPHNNMPPYIALYFCKKG